MAERQQLNTSAHATMGVAGTATITLGPSDRPGAAYWNVTRYSVRNSNPARRGRTPIPTCNVYVDAEDANGWQEGTYDGSFDKSDVDIDLGRGQSLVAVWAGGQAGDVMELSVTGWKR